MKNLQLLFMLIFVPGGLFAQLSVRPNGTSNTYVYVKDEILFVKNAVNLSVNNSADTVQASIYLRGNGQLIQAGTTSSNSGNGFLSVQRKTSPTNAYAYYDWSSPVGNPANNVATSRGTNKNFGINSIYEALGGESGTNARMSAVIPEREGFSEPLTISQRWLYILTEPGTEAEANYQRINTGNSVPAGFGFTMKGVNRGNMAGNSPENHEQIYEFRGRPHSGTFEIPVKGPAQSGSSSMMNAQMTLSGNPYPSTLDLKKFFQDPQNTSLSAIYFYDEDRSVMSHLYSEKPYGHGVWLPGGSGDQNGIYTAATFYIWNAGGTHGGTGTGTGNTAGPNRFAPIGQGFRLVGNGSATTQNTVYIKNEHRVFQPNSPAIFKSASSDNPGSDTAYRNPLSAADLAVSISRPSSQLRLYAVFDEAETRELLLLFSPEASDGYDRGYDGLSPMGMSSDAYFPIYSQLGKTVYDHLPFVIYGTDFSYNKHIPINFILKRMSGIELYIAEEIDKPYENVYLFDSQENSYTQLTHFNSGVAATPLHLAAGNYQNRFFIVFRNAQGKSPGMENTERYQETRSAVSFFQNNPGRKLELYNPEGYHLLSASLFDMRGRKIFHKTNLGTAKRHDFDTGRLSNGIYLVKLLTADGVIIDYKIPVMNQ